MVPLVSSTIKGPLVAECEGVSAEERERFVDAWHERDRTKSRLEVGYGASKRVWLAWHFQCCGVAEYWTMGIEPGHAAPPCPVCDPVGARKDARAIDALARDLWRARPDVVLAEMDRKLEAAELGGDALEALVTVGEYVGRCEAELERLRGELFEARVFLRNASRYMPPDLPITRAE
jgi:hypothetical protein